MTLWATEVIGKHAPTLLVEQDPADSGIARGWTRTVPRALVALVVVRDGKISYAEVRVRERNPYVFPFHKHETDDYYKRERASLYRALEETTRA